MLIVSFQPLPFYFKLSFLACFLDYGLSRVSSSNQSLAEGTSEQAASLEETSSSLEEMSSMTKRNADNSCQMKAMMGEVRKIIGKMDGQMGNMVKAIEEITRSSKKTGKIIRTIDEIAFQTNLLALKGLFYSFPPVRRRDTLTLSAIFRYDGGLGGM